MSANTTDKITDTRNAARPNSARVTNGRSGGGTTLNCDNLSGWPIASKVHFVTYQIDTNSNPVAGTQLDCRGIVSGNDITSFSVIDGTDNGNSVNDVVEMLPTSAWGQDLADALTVLHNRDGTWKTGASLIQPTIADFTNAVHTHASPAQGGLLNGASAITDGTITPAELMVGAPTTWPYSIFTSTATGMSIGNGTCRIYYTQIGKTYLCNLQMIAGASTTYSGNLVFSLPATVAANYNSQYSALGTAMVNINGVSVNPAFIRYNTSTTIILEAFGASGTYATTNTVSNVVPGTMNTSTVIGGTFSFEAV